MIDLKNTYIKNDGGELLDLYLAECKKQGVKWVGSKEMVLDWDGAPELLLCKIGVNQDWMLCNGRSNGTELTITDLQQ